MGFHLYHVDAFTERPFAGNPAAVCLLPEAQDAAWMQAVAREMNLSETAFLVPRADGFDLRWFTPAAEVDLCGHATLASAHVLWSTRKLDPKEPARFHTHSGLLTARRTADGWITMDFPAEPAEPMPAPDGLADALGIDPMFVGHNRLDVLVLLAHADAVRALAPNLDRLARTEARGVIVTAASDDERYDFVSRYFAPRFGIPEDPVTGSAHCCLGPFWQERLGKAALLGYQASARGGVVRVEPQGSRVLLSGQAVTVLRGELTARVE